MSDNPQLYDLGTIRRLLSAAFTADELREICQDNPALQPILESLSSYDSLGRVVATMITYGEKHLLLPEILAEVERRNPYQFARFADDLPAKKGHHAGKEGLRPEGTPVPLPGERAPLQRAGGSPFVVGRPLRATEPIFGREEVFRFLAGQLATFSSANIVAERRMGKTSLLNHLVGRQKELLIPQPDQPPLILACLDLQSSVTNDTRFYGTALRGILDRLPAGRSAEARDFREQRERLHVHPEVSYDELFGALKRLRDARGVCVRPVLIVDEFERLLAPDARERFPFPAFFDGLRALITGELLSMIVASRCPLVDYFHSPQHPDSLTSSFPTYLTPFTLPLLDNAAADQLLLQESDHPLTIGEAAQAKAWAGGHPCHLQAAGKAWYEAKSGGYAPQRARQRFEELKGHSCMVSSSTRQNPSAFPSWLRQVVGLIKEGLRL